MRGFVEVKEDSYEDTIEHLNRIKMIACKLIKMLSEHSDVYDMDEYDNGSQRKGRGRYEY